MFFYSRILPVSGAIPKPGQDISGTIWQQHMRSGEIALFCFDAGSGELLTSKGELPHIPVREHCMVFGSLYTARLSARGQVMTKPLMLCALYNKRGRWLATISREGETRRNPGLGLAWLIFQLPLMALYGTLVILASCAILGRPIRWQETSPQEINGLIAFGLLLGSAGRLLFEFGRRRLVLWHAQPALAAIGTQEREKLYRRLEKNGGSALLVPLDITLKRADIEWPSPGKYAEWAAVLQARGFVQFGAYFIPEAKGSLEFWLGCEHDLTVTIVSFPIRGMWLSAFTRYADASSFAVANKNATELDQHPSMKIVYLGPEATADAVLEEALRSRPEGVRRRPDVGNVLEDYRVAWRTYVEWRRQRGTTAEEYKRVDERRARAKAAGTSQH